MTTTTIMTSVCWARRFSAESIPMSKMCIKSLETATVGRGVGVNRGSGVIVGVSVAVRVWVGVMVGPDGTGVAGHVAVAEGMRSGGAMVGVGEDVEVGAAALVGADWVAM